MNSKVLLFAFAVLALAALVKASNPYHDLAREQMWGTTHIFVWAVAGGMISSVLFLCALIFSCANYFCVAGSRRRAISNYAFAEQGEEVSSQTSTIRSRRSSILLIATLIFFSITMATACIVFNSQMSNDNDVFLNYVDDYVSSFNNLIDNTTCIELGDFGAQDFQNECVRVYNAVSNISNESYNFLWSWDLFLSQAIISVYVTMGIFVFFVTLAGFGACFRLPFLVRIFAVLSLFFAAYFVLLWTLYGLPIDLVQHNCKMVHDSFATNNSDLFPGMPLIALTYNLTDGFQDWDNFNRDLNRDLNHPNRVNLTALIPEQEEVFQMVRSCLWGGLTLNSTLDVFSLRRPMESLRSQSLDIVARINLNLEPYHLELPLNMSQEFMTIHWGNHKNDSESESTLDDIQNQLIAFQASLEHKRGSIKKSVYENATSDVSLLLLQTALLEDIISISDCRPYKQFYRGVNELFCHSFAADVDNAAWAFGFLGLITVLAFFLSFCVGYRMIPATRVRDDESNLGRRAGSRAEANAPLLSEDEKIIAAYHYKAPAGYSYYGTTGPVSYQPAPPVYNPTLNSSDSLNKL